MYVWLGAGLPSSSATSSCYCLEIFHAADSCSSGPRELRQVTAFFHRGLSLWGKLALVKDLRGFGFPSGVQNIDFKTDYSAGTEGWWWHWNSAREAAFLCHVCSCWKETHTPDSISSYTDSQDTGPRKTLPAAHERQREPSPRRAL